MKNNRVLYLFMLLLCSLSNRFYAMNYEKAAQILKKQQIVGALAGVGLYVGYHLAQDTIEWDEWGKKQKEPISKKLDRVFQRDSLGRRNPFETLFSCLGGVAMAAAGVWQGRKMFFRSPTGKFYTNAKKLAEHRNELHDFTSSLIPVKQSESAKIYAILDRFSIDDIQNQTLPVFVKTISPKVLKKMHREFSMTYVAEKNPLPAAFDEFKVSKNRCQRWIDKADTVQKNLADDYEALCTLHEENMQDYEQWQKLIDMQKNDPIAGYDEVNDIYKPQVLELDIDAFEKQKDAEFATIADKIDSLQRTITLADLGIWTIKQAPGWQASSKTGQVEQDQHQTQEHNKNILKTTQNAKEALWVGACALVVIAYAELVQSNKHQKQ